MPQLRWNQVRVGHYLTDPAGLDWRCLSRVGSELTIESKNREIRVFSIAGPAGTGLVNVNEVTEAEAVALLQLEFGATPLEEEDDGTQVA